MPDARSFTTLAAGPCPPVAQLLLALSEGFGPVDAAATLDRLDDDARGLFGIAELALAERAECLARAMSCDLGYAPAVEEPSTLLFDRVVERRRGHPLMLACVAHEVACRAGIETAVWSLAGGWTIGCHAGDTACLVALGEPPGGSHGAAPRRHCAHELAFAALVGLEARYRLSAEPAHAITAASLRERLPLENRSA